MGCRGNRDHLSCLHVAPKGIRALELNLRRGINQQAQLPAGRASATAGPTSLQSLASSRRISASLVTPQRFTLFSCWRVSLGAPAKGNIVVKCSLLAQRLALYSVCLLRKPFWRVRELRRFPRCCCIIRTESLIILSTFFLLGDRHLPLWIKRLLCLWSWRDEGPTRGRPAPRNGSPFCKEKAGCQPWSWDASDSRLLKALELFLEGLRLLMGLTEKSTASPPMGG